MQGSRFTEKDIRGFACRTIEMKKPNEVFRAFAFPWGKVPNGREADEGKPDRMISVDDGVYLYGR